MMACTSPALTARSTPLRISLPSISTCRFLISSSGIQTPVNSLCAERRLATTPAPAPFAIGLATADDPKGGNDQGLEREERDINRQASAAVIQNQQRSGGDNDHRRAGDGPAFPRRRR